MTPNTDPDPHRHLRWRLSPNLVPNPNPNPTPHPHQVHLLTAIPLASLFGLASHLHQHRKARLVYTLTQDSVCSGTLTLILTPTLILTVTLIPTLTPTLTLILAGQCARRAP